MNNKKGFTFIELILVMSIIATLTIISYAKISPALKNLKELRDSIQTQNTEITKIDNDCYLIDNYTYCKID